MVECGSAAIGREETMRTYVSSLGCKLNQSEMDALAACLAAVGHQLVASAAEAELCVLNTCAVTHVAAQKSRQALRRLNRDNPTARLVVTGCYAELAPGDLSGLPGVEIVAGNQDKDQLADLIGRRTAETDGRLATDSQHPTPGVSLLRADIARPRTRALVKIQDGCDNACTYCIIHVARGPQRSRAPDEILEQVRLRLATGYREVVLTGVHIGAYGHDRMGAARGAAGDLRRPGRSDVDLWSLVNRILTETSVPRLRLSSIEPWDLPERAFELWADPRLCRHLHLPLQSGCDATLGRMGRHYTTAEYAALVEAARHAIPDLAITTDVIVGFPGETDSEFAESLAFVQDSAFARGHVFPFSARPGTPAARMPGQVPPPVKDRRGRAMREVAARSQRRFQEGFVGRTMGVLWESSRSSAAKPVWDGLTDNYLRVWTTSSEDLANTLTDTRLVALVKSRLEGKVDTQKTGDGPPAIPR